jgi:uncharacterized protein YjhX (UPF0386 family)
MFHSSRTSFDEGRQMKEAEDHDELKKNTKKIISSKCFARDGSKMENKPFIYMKILAGSSG